uniref:G-protein coupled receptors family 1 profile domain-containing protein n=1 Tax=Plectus sambesii TaxID=2011161 RepID=A0A914X2M8_9BILA
MTDALAHWLGIVSFVLNGWATAACVVSGVVLNLFCIFIFVKRPGRTENETPVIQYYLVTLTAWQTALLLNAFLLYSLPTLLFGHIVTHGVYVLVFPYVYTLANMTHTGSVWIVLTLTIDRYLALCKPLTHRAIGKRTRVKRLMVIVSALAIVFCLPRFFEVIVVEYCSENGTDCSTHIQRSELPTNATYWMMYHIVAAVLFVTLVPCLLLFGLTVRISVALRHAGRKRESMCQAIMQKNLGRDAPMNSKSSNEHRSNVMLVLVIAKFLASDMLPTVLDMLEHVVGGDAFMGSKLATLAVDASNFLLVLNCATNFWIYVIWGKRFRQSCRLFLFGTVCLRRGFSSQNSDATGQRSSATTMPNSSRAAYADYGSNSNMNRSRTRSVLTCDSTVTLISNGTNGHYSARHLAVPVRRAPKARRASALQWNEYQKSKLREKVCAGRL